MLYRRQTQSSITLVQIMGVKHQSASLLHRSVQLLCPYTSNRPALEDSAGLFGEFRRGTRVGDKALCFPSSGDSSVCGVPVSLSVQAHSERSTAVSLRPCREGGNRGGEARSCAGLL